MTFPVVFRPPPAQTSDPGYVIARVKKSADQTAASYSGGGVVTWDTDTYDIGGLHDTGSNTSRFTVPAGVSWVRLAASIHFNALGAGPGGTRIYAYLVKNGSSVPLGSPTAAEYSPTGDQYLTFQSAAIPVVEGDYFEIGILCNDDVSLTVLASSWATMERVSDAALRAMAYKSANQGAVNFATAAAVTWDSSSYDNGDWHDTSLNTSRLTVPADVTHVRLSARVTVQSQTALVGVHVWIAKNGDTDPATRYVNMPLIMEAINASESHYHVFTGPLAVTPGDYFEVFVYNPGDSSITVQGGASDASWFCIEEIEDFSGAMVKKAADLGAANYSAGAVVTWDTEVLDVGGWHDTGSNTSRLTVPAGVYWVCVTAGIGITDLTASVDTYALMIKNGDTNAATRAINLPVALEDQAATENFLLLTTGPVAVTPGDYFEIWPLIPSDASVTIQDYSWFAIERVGW
jgi:hypothetical protein